MRAYTTLPDRIFPETSSPTTVAVLGTGSAGMKHLEAFQSLSNVIPIAIPRRPSQMDRLRAVGFEVSESLEDTARRGASLCVIATDSGKHVEDGIQALNLNFHVLIEKPLATNVTDASRLIDSALKVNKQLYLGCTLRFSDSLNKFRMLLHHIGHVRSAQIACKTYLPDWRPSRNYLESYSARPGEGGVLLDLIHEIDYSGWIFGWPKNVKGIIGNSGILGIESEDQAEMKWETVNGCSISTSLDYLSKHPIRGIRASGDSGSLEWDGITQTVTLRVTGHDVKIFAYTQSIQTMFVLQAQAFVEACTKEPGNRLATGIDGLKALAVCDAIRRSSPTGSSESVSLAGSNA